MGFHKVKIQRGKQDYQDNYFTTRFARDTEREGEERHTAPVPRLGLVILASLGFLVRDGGNY